MKDGLGNHATSDNYRAIAISSLILKLFDWCVLLLEGHKLDCHELQFGFQAGTSTSMCSWALNSVIDYYNSAGSPVYSCTMDLSKAFDCVDFWQLFQKLREKGISPIFLRTLAYIYSKQYCDVRWKDSFSYRFPISRGCRQGAISSPLFFNLYVNILILQLEQSGIGCKIGNKYCGIFVYCDDIFLLSASRPGLQAMVTTCEKMG